jgi:hypothetical protein
MARIILGWARARQGETDAGARDVEQGIALAESSGSSAVSALFYVAAADAHRSAGGAERAHALLDQALVIGEREGALGSLGEAALARALHLLGAEHEPGAVEALLQQAADLTERAGSLWTGLLVHTELARLAPRTGRGRAAHDRLAALYARLTDGFDRGPAREAKAALDELAALLA